MRDLRKIQQLVGNVTGEQLRYVDCAVHRRVGVFMPMAGQCYYAITAEHTHPAYSFILSFDDKCQTRIGNDVVQSVPSTMMMMPPDCPHQELPSDEVSRYIAVMIDSSFFEEQKQVYGVESEPGMFSCFPLSERLVQACKEFLIDYQESFPGYEQLLESGELRICHLIIRLVFGIAQKELPVSRSITIHRVVEYIYSHYRERLSVDDLARQACLSTSHFSRLFRQEMGKSPAEYLLEVRLEFAKRMLAVNEKSLTEIALDCGFGSSSHFSQTFSRALSISPSDYRNFHKLS